MLLSSNIFFVQKTILEKKITKPNIILRRITLYRILYAYCFFSIYM